MNFKVRDTTWFVGVGFSVLLFMVGLFSGFFLSGIPIFFVNMLLFMVGSATIITGSGLLLAAAEVYAKVHEFKENPLLLTHSNLYSVAVGEDVDSLNTEEVLNSLKEDAVFDIETAPIKIINEEINPLPLTKDELLAKIDKVQEIIKSNKEVPIVPLHKPTIHHQITDNRVETSQPDKASELLTLSPQGIPADLKKIILVGDKGIDPTSEKFKELLERAFLVEDPGFMLRLKGKTFGLGSRGVKVQRKNTEFTAFSKSDISKMLKKF